MQPIEYQHPGTPRSSSALASVLSIACAFVLVVAIALGIQSVARYRAGERLYNAPRWRTWVPGMVEQKVIDATDLQRSAWLRGRISFVLAVLSLILALVALPSAIRAHRVHRTLGLFLVFGSLLALGLQCFFWPHVGVPRGPSYNMWD
jgi:hypothetical protein